jgi:CHAT domain-containing protein
VRARATCCSAGERRAIAGWLARDPGRYRFLHFAAHALVDDERADRTVLVLADRGLALSDIRRLCLTAELVTLSRWAGTSGARASSGCRTPSWQRGPAVRWCRFWRVGDRSTADFMQRFYEEVAVGYHPAEAL